MFQSSSKKVCSLLLRSSLIPLTSASLALLSWCVSPPSLFFSFSHAFSHCLWAYLPQMLLEHLARCISLPSSDPHPPPKMLQNFAVLLDLPGIEGKVPKRPRFSKSFGSSSFGKFTETGFREVLGGGGGGAGVGVRLTKIDKN